MKYTRLGRSGARVSRIALGTMNFGPVIDEEASFAILDEAVEKGITFFDTADVYGGGHWGPYEGQTEEILGRWFASRGARDRIVLATKAHGVMGDGENDRGLSATHIRRAVDASLTRLQTDHIDLYQAHHIDREVPVDEVLEAFDLLRAQGKISYFGTSNFAAWHLTRYREEAARTGRPPIVTEQPLYNLAQRTIELEVVPAAEHYGIGLLPWSPLGGGLLGGILAKTDHKRSSVDRIGDKRPQVEAYEQLARDLGIAPGTLAIAWLLHQPVVTAPLVGPRLPEQLRSAIDAVDVELDADVLARLDEIWPGPGVAPESYSW